MGAKGQIRRLTPGLAPCPAPRDRPLARRGADRPPHRSPAPGSTRPPAAARMIAARPLPDARGAWGRTRNLTAGPTPPPPRHPPSATDRCASAPLPA